MKVTRLNSFLSKYISQGWEVGGKELRAENLQEVGKGSVRGKRGSHGGGGLTKQ